MDKQNGIAIQWNINGRNRNEVPLSATTWMSLEKHDSKSKKQSLQTTSSKSHLCDMLRKGKSIETESRLTITWDQEDKGQ